MDETRTLGDPQGWYVMGLWPSEGDGLIRPLAELPTRSLVFPSTRFPVFNPALCHDSEFTSGKLCIAVPPPTGER